MGTDDDLLFEVIGLQGNDARPQQVRTYKGARTTLTIRKQIPNSQADDLTIDQLTLWIDVMTHSGQF